MKDYSQKSINDLKKEEINEIKSVICKFPRELQIVAERLYQKSINLKHLSSLQEEILFNGLSRDEIASLIQGKQFLSNDGNICVGILSPSPNENFSDDEFVFEQYEKYDDGSWHCQDYIWLQEQTDSKYTDIQMTTQANLNIGSENMFHIGCDGNLYVDVTCGGDYVVLTPIEDEEKFEKIRAEAIENDGEYEVSY